MFGRKINFGKVLFSTVSIPLAKPHQPVVQCTYDVKWHYTSAASLSHSFMAKDQLDLSILNVICSTSPVPSTRVVYSNVSGPEFYLNSDPDSRSDYREPNLCGSLRIRNREGFAVTFKVECLNF
jgi:hypothetical protein